MWVIYFQQTPLFKGECEEDLVKFCSELNKKFGQNYTIKHEES